MKLFTNRQELTMVLHMLGSDEPLGTVSESEAERRLRLLSEATEHMLFCERDFEEMGEAAVTPFSTSHWKEE